MILRRFRRTPEDDSIARLYGAIVAQARRPGLYLVFSVPDTVNGRFEMVVLHATLVLRRLDAEPVPPRRLGQGIFDLFCSDMDANLREMGVGDIAVPRKMRAIGEAFYGRKRAYEAALASSVPQPLAAALARNVYGSDPAGNSGIDKLVGYVRTVAACLDAQNVEALLHGKAAFPDPLDVAQHAARGVP